MAGRSSCRFCCFALCFLCATFSLNISVPRSYRLVQCDFIAGCALEIFFLQDSCTYEHKRWYFVITLSRGIFLTLWLRFLDEISLGRVFPFLTAFGVLATWEATTGTSSTFLLNPLKQLQGSLILRRIYFSHMIWPWHSGLNCVNECCKSEIKHAPLTRATALNHERDNFLFSEELRTNPISSEALFFP